MNRLIIIGNKNENNYQFLKDQMDHIMDEIGDASEIISIPEFPIGGFLWKYVANKGIPLKIFPADLDKFGIKGPFIRNYDMAKYTVSNESKGILVSFLPMRNNEILEHLEATAIACGIEIRDCSQR